LPQVEANLVEKARSGLKGAVAGQKRRVTTVDICLLMSFPTLIGDGVL
jgi:hypothetical protein